MRAGHFSDTYRPGNEGTLNTNIWEREENGVCEFETTLWYNHSKREAEPSGDSHKLIPALGEWRQGWMWLCEERMYGAKRQKFRNKPEV